MTNTHGIEAPTRYRISDGIDPEWYEYEAGSPREAVEQYLATYDWRLDLAEDYGERGLKIAGTVREGNRVIAHFHATPEGITSFAEVPPRQLL